MEFIKTKETEETEENVMSLTRRLEPWKLYFEKNSLLNEKPSPRIEWDYTKVINTANTNNGRRHIVVFSVFFYY